MNRDEAWWCECMKSMRYDTSQWKVCPKCLTPRPEPREKELAEVIKYADGAWGVGRYYPPICDEYAKFVSNYALDWFIERIEKHAVLSGWVQLGFLIDEIREWKK